MNAIYSSTRVSLQQHVRTRYQVYRKKDGKSTTTNIILGHSIWVGAHTLLHAADGIDSERGGGRGVSIVHTGTNA